LTQITRIKQQYNDILFNILQKLFELFLFQISKSIFWRHCLFTSTTPFTEWNPDFDWQIFPNKTPIRN